jgi:1-acyl-sn-glycerol-3-phosphate acyltransferase
MVERVERVGDFLAGGGNLFVFPEGTRSRDGQVGRFNPGAFKIARHCRAPIRVVSIRNTDRMFRPDSFAFATRGPNMIRVQLVGAIDPGVVADAPLSRVLEAARSMLVSAAGQPAPETTLNIQTPAGGETQP